MASPKSIPLAPPRQNLHILHFSMAFAKSLYPTPGFPIPISQTMSPTYATSCRYIPILHLTISCNSLNPSYLLIIIPSQSPFQLAVSQPLHIIS